MLAAEGIHILRWTELDEAQGRVLQAMFSKRIFPVLTPLAVDPGVRSPTSRTCPSTWPSASRIRTRRLIHFARIKIPPLLARFVSREPGIFVPLEDVIAAEPGPAVPGHGDPGAPHLPRDAQRRPRDRRRGAEDLLEALEEEIRRRRTSPAVRLEVEETMPPEHCSSLLMSELEVGSADVYTLPGPLDLAGLAEPARDRIGRT